MARPTDHQGEAKTAILNIRVTPSFKARLEATAKNHRRSTSAEAEARLVRSIEQAETRTPATEALLDEIEAEIAVIESAKGGQWHKGIGTWAAVREMLKEGPITARAPASLGDHDAALLALHGELADIWRARATIIARLDFAGIKSATLSAMIAPALGGRLELRARIDAELSDDLRDKALAEIEQLEALDDQERATHEKVHGILRPLEQRAEEGRALYADRPERGETLRVLLARLDASANPWLRIIQAAGPQPTFKPKGGVFGNAGAGASAGEVGLLPTFRLDAAEE